MHSKGLQSIQVINEQQPSSLVTIGTDGSIRVWSVLGDLYGEINTVTHKRAFWTLPYDFLTPIISEVRAAVAMIEVIDKCSFTSEQIDRQISKYLYENYI